MIKFLRFVPVALLMLISATGFSAALSGVYTIGGSSPSYATFTAAVNALLVNGVSGKVVFNVRAGTYTDQVTLSAVTGASAANTITFQSATGNAADVTLQYSATLPAGNNGAGNNWVINLNGASYISFNNLTLVATGTAYANVVYMYNYSDYDTVKNCVITGITSTSASMEQVLVNLAADQNYGEPSANGEVVLNCILNNGSYGVYTWSGNESEYFAVQNSTFNNQYAGAIYAYRAFSCPISNNIISTNVSNSAYYGIYVDVAYGTYIYDNQIYNCPGDGITFFTGIALIYNNFVVTVGASTTYGITFYNSEGGGNIGFNSVLVLNTNAASSALNLPSGFGQLATMEDNLFINRGGGYAANVTTSTVATLNYNDYYATGTYLGIYNSTKATTLANWQSALTGCGCVGDANSISVNPDFVSNSDLHITFDNLRFGTPFDGITTDIDGQTRNAVTPDMGADEYAALATPNFKVSTSSVCIDGNVTFTDQTGNNPTAWLWTFNGGTPHTSTQQNPVITYDTAGIYNVKLVVTNAAGTDSITIANAITVTPQSVAGTATANPTTVCPRSATQLSLTGYTGSIQWQGSINSGNTYYPVNNDTSSPAAANPDSTTIYRAMVQSGNCPAVYSSTQTVTVNPVGCGTPILLTGGGYPANCGLANGTIYANASRGDGSDQYTIVFYGPTFHIESTTRIPEYSDALAGAYKVTAWDTDYPADSVSITFTVVEAICGSATVTNTASDCVVDGTIYATATGGDGHNNYIFTAAGPSNPPSQTGTSALFTGLEEGCYYVYVADAANPTDGYQTTVYSVCIGSDGPCTSNQATPSLTGSQNFAPCYNSNETYTTDANMMSYTWNYSGGTLVAGGGINDDYITLNWSTGSGYVSVSYIDEDSVQSFTTSDNVNPATCNTAIQATVTSTNTTTCNGSDGTIIITSVSGGDGSGYYTVFVNGNNAGSFYPNQLPYTLTGYGIAEYSVVITNADDPGNGNNDEYSGGAVIYGPGPYVCPEQLSLYINEADAECGMSDGSIFGGAGGGTNTSYNFHCDNCNQPDQDNTNSFLFTGLAPGTYTVIATDYNNASSTGSTTITVNNNTSNCNTGCTAAEPTISVPTGLCAGYTVVFNESSGNTYSSYSWSGSGSVSLTNSGAASQSAYLSNAGSGGVALNVTDANNCTATVSVNVNINTPASGTITGPGVACINKSYVYSVASGGSNYQWTLDTLTGSNGYITGGQGTNDVSITWAPDGYGGAAAGYVAVTFTDANGCYINPGNQAVAIDNQLQRPLVTATDSAICPSDSSQLAVPGGYASYRWNTGDTTATTYAKQTGEYSVTVSDVNGCTVSSQPVGILVYPAPQVSFVQHGDTLVASGGIYYQWYLDSNVINGATGSVYNARVSGNYAVQGTDTSGCWALSDYAYVFITGITSLTGTGSISVYPDPFVNAIFIKADNISGIENIQVYDLLGEEVLNKRMSLSNSTIISLDVSILPAGAYYLRIKTDGGDYVQKMVKAE